MTARKNEKKKPNWIIRNLMWGAIFFVGILLIIRIVLAIVTQHGITVEVPDFHGQSMAYVNLMAQQKGMRIVVTDSVYVNNIPKGSVFSQNPKPGTEVKRGRTVYLVTNAHFDRMVRMPDLVGYSLRQAQVEIAAAGLKPGRLDYVTDIATDNVLGQFIKGVPVPADSVIKYGSRVDLLLGLSPEDTYTAVPNVIGLKSGKAIMEIKAASLNIGKLFYDSTVRNASDSTKAFVYMVSPNYEGYTPRRGTDISIYLTLDPLKLPVAESETEEETPEESI